MCLPAPACPRLVVRVARRNRPARQALDLLAHGYEALARLLTEQVRTRRRPAVRLLDVRDADLLQPLLRRVATDHREDDVVRQILAAAVGGVRERDALRRDLGDRRRVALLVLAGGE